MPDDSNRRRLYNNLVNAGYDLPDYGQFSQDMMDGNNMRRLHTKLTDAGYELPDYSQFRADMGYSMDAEEVNENDNGYTPKTNNAGTGSGGGLIRNVIRETMNRGRAAAQEPAGTSTNGNAQKPASAQMPVLNNDTAQRIDWRNSVINSNEQAPEQKDEQPLGPERFAKKMEMDAALNQRNEDFHARMENIRKGSNNFGGNREQRFNPGTGRIEQVYITQSGDETNTPMEQREMNARFRGSTDLGFEERLNSAMYNVDPDNIAEQVWADAESRLAEKQTADLANIARNNMGITPTGAGTVAFTTAKNHMTYYDIKKLSDEAWNRLGEEQKQALVNDMYGALMARYPGLDEERAWSMANDLARQQSDKRMFELAVTKNAPKDATDYFFKRVIGANSLTKLIDITARAAAGTRGDMDARDAALERYGEGHKFVGFLGSAFGMALDPFTYAAGGVGGGLSKGVTWLGGRLIGRSGMSRLGGRLLTGAAGGGGNFATFEAGQEALEQLRYGGKVEGVDEAGRYIVGDYDPKAIGTAAARGYLIGSATGVISPLTGNVSDQLVRSTGNTVTKAGIRAGQVVTSKMAEGTIFSVPEWIETYNNYATLIAAVSDPNSVDYIADEQERAQRITQLQAERGEAMMDVWTDNEAMMLAFGIQGATKSIPRRLEELRRNPQSRAGFETRLRTLLDGRDDLALTKDEQNELSRAGYGDLRDLVKDYKQNAQSDGEVPYTRIEVLMSDANVSEAARAKMYYYVTGRMLPMSTVIGSNLIETKDAQGNVTGYTVQSIGARGVVTSREFDNKRRADVELERINRQAELNSIDMGEQYVDYRGEVRRMYEACEQTADEVGAGVRNLYELMKRDPAELNAIEQRWVERVRNNYESLGDRYSASALRREISEQYGVDIDAAIAKEPNRRSDTEQQAIQAYGERLFEDVRPDEQQNGDATDIVVLLEGRADTPYERGYHADSEEGKEIALEYANGIGYRTPEQRQAAMDGVRQQIEDRAATSAAEEREIAAQYTYEDGSERPATMLLPDGEGNYNEAQVYVKSGNIVMNGDAIDADRSDQTVIVFNPRTGLKQQVATSDLTMGVARSAEEVEAEIEQRRQQFIQREWDVLTNKVFPGNEIGVEGGRATVLAMDDQTATLLMPDGSQADMPIADVQRLKDDERLAEYIATHPDARAANEQGTAATDTGDGTAAAGSQPAEVEGVPTDYSEGMKVTLRDGRTMEVTAVGRMSSDENGIYFEPQANGQIVELFDPQTGDNEHLDRKQMNAQVVSYQAAPEATTAAVEDRTAAAPAETPVAPEQPITPEAPATAETPATPEALETGATPEAPAASSMPMRKVKVRVGKKAEEVEEPDFMAVTPEETRRWIYEESGYPEAVASQLIQSKITEANNQLDNLRKNEPKFGDKGIGTSVAAYNQRHNEWQQQQQSWKQTLDYWTNVWQQQLAINNEREAAERAERLRRNEEVRKAIEAEQRAKEAEEAERKAEAEAKRQQVEDELAATAEVKGEPLTLGERVEVPARLQQMIDNATGNRAVLLRQAVEELGDDPEALDLLTDEHPRTLEEVAASMLRSGKNQVRLMFADEGVLKGVGSMMGYTRADMSRFPSLFASREKGGVSIERFGEMVEEEARNEGVMYDENDATAGLTAVQNLLGSVSTQADINDYLLNGRIEDAREKRANAIRMMEIRYEEEIRQRYDMTAAERDAWVAYMDERADAVAEMSDEEFNNQILSYNGNQTARDTEQLQEEQSGESGTDEGGRNEGNEEGAGIRSEADETAGAPDDAGRDRQGSGRAEGTEQPASPVAEAIARQEVNENPTEGQKESGNYKKAHVRLDGYDLTIENKKGSVRSGVDPNGKSWSQEMHNDYGYILGTEGVDGDHIDVFLSDTPEEGDVFVVDQVNADGTFDEHKVMYGFPDIESARQAYLSNYEDGWQGLGAITPVSKEEFKKWVESSHRKTKPFSEYRSVETLGDVQVENGVKEQKGDDAAEGTQIPSEAEKALRDGLIEAMRGDGGMDVITDEEGQRVLDEYRDQAKLLKTFHGSGADFDAFDHSHMGEGEGNQAYGYGTYVTEVEGIGKRYAHIAASADEPYNDVKYVGSTLNDADAKMLAGLFDGGLRDWQGVLDFLQNSGSRRYLEKFKTTKSEDWIAPTKDRRYLYMVEIPDDDGHNYVDWVATIPKSDRRRIADAVRGLEGEPAQSVKYANYTGGWNQLADMIERNAWAYQEVRDRLVQAFGGRTADEKRVSDLMHEAGFVGVKYPAEYMSGGRSDGAKNYVIFDEGDLKITDKIRFHKAENGEYEPEIKPTFYSNAERAVEGIKQEKATPEQWLKMIEKAGGLKAGEDKWLGLSDWLRGLDGRDGSNGRTVTLTKQEVLDYIRQNRIEIEEVEYKKDPLFSINSRNNFESDIAGARKIGESDKSVIELWDRMYGMNLMKAYNEGRFTIDENGKVVTSEKIVKPINETRLQYTTEGLENKREIALTVPTVEPWNEGDEIHFGDAGEGRAVAWVRFGETTVTRDFTKEEMDVLRERNAYLDELREKYGEDYVPKLTEEENKKIHDYQVKIQEINNNRTQRVLVIDEIQSKRHQEGREKGYRDESLIAKTKEDYKKAKAELDAFIESIGNKLRYELTEEQQKRYDKLVEAVDKADTENYESKNGVPDAPFDKNWHELAMKRMLRYAAENGYDKVAWTTGEQQAERYDLGTELRAIEAGEWADFSSTFGDEAKEAKLINASTYNNQEVFNMMVNRDGKILSEVNDQWIGRNLSDVVGKDMAVRLMAEGRQELSGGYLRVGTDGMKGFYDQILPRFVDKYGKKWAVKTEDVRLDRLNGENGLVMHAVDVTPEMKESVMEGQPMFFRTEEGEVYGFTMDRKIYIDPKVATSETPIHEYSHLWAQALRKANPQAWEQLKSEMMKDQELVDYVRRKYPEIENEDALMEEVFAHYSGRRGAERLRTEMRDEMDKADGVFNKAQVASVFARLKSLLSKFWKMARNLFAGKVRGVKKLSAEDFADMTLNDLMNGFKPNEVTTEEEEKTLMGVHNISEEKLKKALKQGGFANPSMAVIDTKKVGFDSYGEISLIPKASLIDSRTGRNAGTWAGDAWTPTYPQVEKQMSDKGTDVYYKDVNAVSDNSSINGELKLVWDNYLDGRSPDNLAYWFLMDRGIEPKKEYFDSGHTEEQRKRFAELTNNGNKKFVDMTDNERAAIIEMMAEDRGISAEELLANYQKLKEKNEELLKDESLSPFRKITKQKVVDDVNTYGVSLSAVNDFMYGMESALRSDGTLNVRGTLANARDYMQNNGLRSDFSRWLEEKEAKYEVKEMLFDGFTRDGIRKYLPNTLENASRMMNRDADVNAGEQTGFGPSRAMLLGKMQSLDDIRKNKSKLQGVDEDIEQRYKDARDEMFEVVKALSDMQKISDNPFSNVDYANVRLNEALTKEDPIEYLNKEYDYDISKKGKFAKSLKAMLQTIENLPSKYFETKFKRPVMLDEFAVAVVPEGTSQEVVDALQNAGLDVRTYDGTSENRQAVTLEAVRGRDDIRFQKGGTYKTKDGKQLTMQSLLDEVDGQTRLFDSEGEVIAPAESSAHEDVGGPAGAAEDLTGLRLRKLKPGETCLVERRYEENKMFSFVGKEKIESMDDVAFIFKQLEDAAVENVFVAMVKDGRPTVIHIGMGTYNQSVADYKLAFAAYAKIKPDKVWMVHNHPSGSLRASRDDRNLLQVGRETFGNDVMQDGIIIDTVSGKYGVFNDFGENYEQNMPEASRDAVPVKTYEFSKQVFAPEWNPREAFQLSDSGKVAEFVSSHRLGEHKKMSFIVTNNQNQVVGNFFLPWTKMSDAAKKPEDASRELSNYVNLAGGTKGVLYGNYEYDSKENRALGKLIESMRKLRTPLLDVVHLDKEAVYHSAAETGAMEPEGEYGLDGSNGQGDSEIRYRIREEAAPTKTGIGYKVFVLKDGKLYPPMVANPNGEATPVGVWLDADAAPVAGVTKTGRQQVKAGGKGTQGGSGKLAYRPGWHLGEIPYALQFNRMNPETGQRELFPANFVWAEVEYADDVDYQEEAMSYGMNTSGKFQHSLAGLPRLPKNGSYKYRTNPDPNTDPWIITGAMKVNRILKPSEVDAMVEAAGREPQQRQAGAITDEQVEALNAEVQRTMQEDRDMMLSTVKQMGEKLHTKINIVESGEGLKGRQQRAKGWYNPVTGEVTLVLGNNRDVEDVKATVGHEVIGHKGMRELVGEERYNDFLDMVYKHLRGDLKARVDSRAGREFMNEVVGSNGSNGRYEEHRRRAVDELLGELAEKPFDEFSEGERTLWQRIKQAVREILDRFLDTLRLPKWFELGDNELRYMLWRSKERMERGKMDYADMARDAVKRRELGLDDELRFRDDDAGNEQQPVGRLGLYERMSEVKLASAEKNAGDLNKRNEAIRAIDANLRDLEKAMRAQREYDRTTVKRVSDLAQILMKYGWLENMGKQEVSRVLSAIKNANGKEDISNEVQTVIDVMVDNQLRRAEKRLEEMESIKAVKVDAKGVEVQGALDVAGQTMMKAFKEARRWSKENIDQEIADVQDRMGSNNAAVAEEAAQRFVGLQLAKEYVENIKESKEDAQRLRQSIKDYDGPAKSKKDFIANVEDAIRQNKVERIESYQALMQKMADPLTESVMRAEDFKEREVERIREIQHNANSDMEGRPSDEHYQPKWKDKAVNNPAVRFFTAPLATFDQMLRLMGSKSANGEGYLYNRFMRGWVDARQQEIRGVRRRYAELDKKVAEIFGGRINSMGKLIRSTGSMPKMTVEIWNGGMMQPKELTQGNLMYIYMVNKMNDGRMKLAKMGITEPVMDAITEKLDKRLKQLADWIQDEFLVETRNEYNKTHKRVFGANMASIEHYFPLKILKNALVDKPEDLDNPNMNDGISTVTGAIKKRTMNALALDVTGADALNVVLEHVAQMEHWNAYAEFNRDLNTLRTYKRFRNQVQNMTTIYGSGKELWEKFNDVCQMAAGSYRPPRANFDTAALNFAKGVTAAKVSFRVFTALKQFLSAPAYLSDARPDLLVANIVNPAGAWKWAMENLPIFEERWKSRMAGDPRLLKSEKDWKIWRNNIVQMASKIGMSPNAFVDAVTVSIGAHSIYQSRKARYLKEGYSEEQAERRAIQDADIAYNETQQSSEGAFLSPMQVDRSWLSVMFTVFRNASMAYTRQLWDAVRNMKRNLTPRQRKESIEYMTKQLVREGLSEAQAGETARRRFRRQIGKDAVRVAVFGYILQFAWNLGAYLPYLIFGDDDDEKQKMWDDIWAHTTFGWLEGFTGGDVISQAGEMLLTGEGNPSYLSKDMPLSSDVANILRKLGSGKGYEALNDVINLVVQSGIGVNPQSITDGVLAIMDACGDDPALANEAAICIMRILQVPQSQIEKIYFDEVGLRGDEVSQYTPQQLAERYARYKVKRGRLVTPWMWNDAEQLGKQEDKATTIIKERMERMGDAEVNAKYEQLAEEMKDMGARERAAKAAAKRDYAEAARLWTEIGRDAALYNRYQQFKAQDKQLDRLAEEYLSAKSAEEAAEKMEQLIQLKKQMVDDLASE